nr:tetratricopeptide repeat protein [Methanosarcina sp. MTP4]
MKKDYYQAYFLKGLSIYYETENYKKAKEAFEKTIEYNPNHADAWNNLGIVFYDLEKYEDAKRSFEESIEYCPTNALSYIYLGKVLLNFGDRMGAAEKVKEAFSQNTKNKFVQSQAWCLDGLVKIKKLDYEGAIDSFEKAISLDPTECKFGVWKAYAKYLKSESVFKSSEKTNFEYQKQIQEIIRDLEAASQLYEKCHDGNLEKHKEIRAYILYFLGCCYYKINEFHSAVEKFKACRKLMPKTPLNESAKNLLKDIWYYRITPPSWEWWLSSPIHKYYNWLILLFLFILIVGILQPLFLFSEKNYDIPHVNFTIIWRTYAIQYSMIILLIIFILLFPNLKQVSGKGFEVHLRHPIPIIEFNPPIPPFRFDRSADISVIRKCSRMLVDPMRRTTDRWHDLYPDIDQDM